MSHISTPPPSDVLTLLTPSARTSPAALPTLLHECGFAHTQSLSLGERHGVSAQEYFLTRTPRSDRDLLLSELRRWHQASGVDLALQPNGLARRHKRLVVFDADMTFLQCEIINEMSALVGQERAVEALTEQAMLGTLDFRQALLARVRLLRGLSRGQLQQLAARVPFTAGTTELVQTLRRLGCKTAIVSGGFQWFIDEVQRRFGLDYGFANQLEWRGDVLTGELLGDIVDAARKEALLREIAAREDIPLEQVVAIGDGANDANMLSAAGLGVAFNAKPALQDVANGFLTTARIDHLLFYLGITAHEQTHL